MILGEGEDKKVVDEVSKRKEGEYFGSEAAMQLNISSMVGMTSKRSLKVWGMVGGLEVIALVVSRASNNFIFFDLVK